MSKSPPAPQLYRPETDTYRRHGPTRGHEGSGRALSESQPGRPGRFESPFPEPWSLIISGKREAELEVTGAWSGGGGQVREPQSKRACGSWRAR